MIASNNSTAKRNGLLTMFCKLVTFSNPKESANLEIHVFWFFFKGSHCYRVKLQMLTAHVVKHTIELQLVVSSQTLFKVVQVAIHLTL